MSMRLCASSALAIVLVAACAAAPEPVSAPQIAAPASPTRLAINVLSSRYDLVSGGDALVEIRAEGGSADDLALYLNGRDYSGTLIHDAASNTLRGVVKGLQNGTNWLQATAPDGVSVSQALQNHPATGPILSGPHLSPYECRTVESNLGEATDANCSAPVRHDWFYRTTGNEFKPLADPRGARPADVARAKTIEGADVPYIVRVESGVINRAIYRIAVLDDPATDGVAKQEGWNGRLAVSFGGGCGTQYSQGANQAANALSDLYLSRGFAFAVSTELVNQQHCNQVLQGEKLMMLKEHFIETYGVPKWTVGTGGSGGAIQQLTITQMYPGLLDGLQPSLSYPDSSMNTADCGLLQNFWRSKDGQKWSQEKKTAVEGYTPGTCAAWERSFVRTLIPDDGCDLKDASNIYNAKNNPKGVRCTTQEMRVNIYGRDAKTGYARRPIDNVGVQYGLKALNDGTISIDEFLTLNEKVGGNDMDGGFTSKRTVGDVEAIKAIYASGLINTFGGGIANAPILHYRPYTDAIGDIHDRHRDLTIRARIEKAMGRSDHQVIWVAPIGSRGGASAAANVDVAPAALDTMTKWLDAMAADPAPLNTDKVVRHKPAEAVDAYWTAEGRKVVERASWDTSGGFNETYPVHLEPRLIAGAPAANDVIKCQLKPVAVSDYQAKFSSAQERRLKRVFADGVCDWSKPSVGYSKIAGTYQRY